MGKGKSPILCASQKCTYTPTNPDTHDLVVYQLVMVYLVECCILWFCMSKSEEEREGVEMTQ